ncbi:hypothetical protein HZA96_07195 [Candidatus Woesearchaeota archaeon]|nr:hypothetical protein [Candidatus Woesearchaeota archaeon]
MVKKGVDVNNSLFMKKNRAVIIVGFLFVIGFVFLILSLNNQSSLTSTTGNVISLNQIKSADQYFYITNEEGTLKESLTSPSPFGYIFKLTMDQKNNLKIIDSTGKEVSLAGLTKLNPKICEVAGETNKNYLTSAIISCSNAPCKASAQKSCLKIELLQQEDIDLSGNKNNDIKIKMNFDYYDLIKTKYHGGSDSFSEYKNKAGYIVEELALGWAKGLFKYESVELSNSGSTEFYELVLKNEDPLLCNINGKIVSMNLDDMPFNIGSVYSLITSTVPKIDFICNKASLASHIVCGAKLDNKINANDKDWSKIKQDYTPYTNSFYTIAHANDHFFYKYTDFACMPTYVNTGSAYSAFGSFIECDAKNDGSMHPNTKSGIKAPLGILAETKKDIFLWDNYKGNLPTELFFTSPSYILKPQEYAQHLLCAPFDKYESWFICDPNNDFPKQTNGVTKKLKDKVIVGKDYYTCAQNGWTKGDYAPCKGKKNGFIILNNDKKTTTICYNAGQYTECNQKNIGYLAPITSGVTALCTKTTIASGGNMYIWSECDANNDGLITSGYKTTSYKKMLYDKQNICANYNNKDTWLSCMNGAVISPNLDFKGTTKDDSTCTKDGWTKTTTQTSADTNKCVSKNNFEIIENKEKSEWVLCYNKKEIICNAASLNKEQKKDLTTKYVCKSAGWIKIVDTPGPTALGR